MVRLSTAFCFLAALTVGFAKPLAKRDPQQVIADMDTIIGGFQNFQGTVYAFSPNSTVDDAEVSAIHASRLLRWAGCGLFVHVVRQADYLPPTIPPLQTMHQQASGILVVLNDATFDAGVSVVV